MKKLIVMNLAMLFVVANATAQSSNNDINFLGQLNTITTAVPFLIISPDARAGGMGDLGVASTPDANSTHWNPAKLCFAEDNIGISISHTPWLRQLVPDISLSYLSFYKKIDDQQAFGASLRYFSLGDIVFTDINGNEGATFNPNEFAVDGSYSRKLADRFSTAISLRFIYSNLTGGLDMNNQTKPGVSVAGDLSFYYRNTDIDVGGRDAEMAFGLNVSNMGAKISYSSSGQESFIPANIRLGGLFSIEIDQYNSISFMVELSKLLVPTSPYYERDSTGRLVPNNNGGFVILEGQDATNKSGIEGIFSSFSDAPGGAREEFREINYQVGVEYWYDKQFAVRGGYFYEHPTKGGRHYFTMGAGLKYSVFNINFAYLIPVPNNSSGLQSRSPLENTLRFSLNFNLDAFKEPGKKS